MRLRRPLVAWFALLALLLAGQGPLAANFAPAAVRVALCTAQGIRLVALGAGDEAPSAPDHASVPHCPLCAPSHGAAATPPEPAVLVVTTAPVPAIRAVAPAIAPAPRLHAQSRAQPPPFLS